MIPVGGACHGERRKEGAVFTSEPGQNFTEDLLQARWSDSWNGKSNFFTRELSLEGGVSFLQ